MKRTTVAAFAIVAMSLMQPGFAATEPSTDASNLTGDAALASIATPVLAAQAGSAAAVAGVDQIVRIVDAAGKGLAELTEETFALATDVADDLSSVRVRLYKHKKEIPLVVRKDYLELNEKVKTE